MLKLIRDGQRWIVGSVVFLVGIGFVFFMAQGRPASIRNMDDVAVVSGVHIGQRAFQRVRAQQEDLFRQTMGEQFDPNSSREEIDQTAISLLVQNVIFELEAKQLGLFVSDDEIRTLVGSFPGLRGSDGRFLQEVYKDYAERNFGSETNFVAAIRSELLAARARLFLIQSVNISDDEVRDALRFERERVALNAVAIPVTPKLDAKIPPDELQAFLKSEDARLRSSYQERIDEFELPEKAHIRQIFLALPSDANAEKIEDVRKRAEAIRRRILDGADFGEIAKAESEDPSSKAKGGDLGEIARGQLIPALEQIAFSIKTGEVSEPIQTPSGFHLLLTEKYIPASLRSFEEVREDLAREAWALNAADAQAQQKADSILERLRAGETMEAAAKQLGLKLQRTGLFARNPNNMIPGLGESEKLLQAAFAPNPPGTLLNGIFNVERKRVIAQVAERETLSEDDLEKELPVAREQLLKAKRNEYLRNWIQSRQVALASKGQLVINQDFLR